MLEIFIRFHATGSAASLAYQQENVSAPLGKQQESPAFFDVGGSVMETRRLKTRRADVTLNSKLGKLYPAPLLSGAMKPTRRQLFSCLTTLIVTLGELSSAAENERRILATSPSGEWRVEVKDGEFWIVSSKSGGPEEKLPVESAERAPVEFHFSPDEKWIFTLPDGGSCLRPGDLFYRNADGAIDSIASFDTKAWEQAARLSAFAKNTAAEGACAMMRFIGWSLDSSRLLIGLRGGHGKFEMDGAYLYFDTRTKGFQITPYLRKLNKVTSDILSSSDDVLPCAEPPSPLPTAKDLKARLDQLDRQLNKKYAEIIAQTPAEQVVFVRSTQRDWIKHRDEGLKLYLSLYPKTEKEARRLQFLGDVTAARIQVAPEKWGTAETWLY